MPRLEVNIVLNTPDEDAERVRSIATAFVDTLSEDYDIEIATFNNSDEPEVIDMLEDVSGDETDEATVAGTEGETESADTQTEGQTQETGQVETGAKPSDPQI